VAGAGTSTCLSVAADGAFVIRQTGQRLGHHLLRNLISADGELNACEAEHVVWDVIAVSAGMGGCWDTGWPGLAAGCHSSRKGRSTR
jgi:hypothetical protein